MATTDSSQTLVLVNRQNGIVVIPATPLKRLNYFNGKFLRAEDLKLEQDYLRQLVHQSNQAGGPGVVHGFDLTRGAGDTIVIGEGFAIDPRGRVLLLPKAITINVQELIDKSLDVQRQFRKATALRDADFDECEFHNDEPTVEVEGRGDIFQIVISPAEALCGEEDVFGKLCEEACATSTDRPYLMEGLTIRALRLGLRSPYPNSRARSLTQTHLRSRVASAYFEDERRRVASLISKFGLEQETWCLGADATGGSGVAIGVLAREGNSTVFLDPWIVRRERMDTPPKRYWQWRMMMRPWDVFLAQVLQFQCQLHDLFKSRPQDGDDDDPCGGARGVIREAATAVDDFRKLVTATSERLIRLNLNPDEVMKFEGGLTRLNTLNDRLFTVGKVLEAQPRDELLVRGGIVELPSAGYLPVVPGQNATINQQVRRLMGPGVDLRFCVVRPDYVAHALEEAQHMERISLLQGLDNSSDKPQVDILVPNGEIVEQKRVSPGKGFDANVQLNSLLLAPSTTRTVPSTRNIPFTGAARIDKLGTSGGAFYLSCEHRFNFASTLGTEDLTDIRRPTVTVAGDTLTGVTDVRTNLRDTIRLAAEPVTTTIGLWMSLQCAANVFLLRRGDSTNFNARVIVGATGKTTPTLDAELNGIFQVTAEATSVGTSRVVRGRIENAQLSFLGDAFEAGGPRKSIFVDFDVTVELSGQSRINILLDHAQTDIALSAKWDKQPLEVEASIVQKRATNVAVALLDLPLLEALLKENEDVLLPTNASHVQALRALQVVAKTLTDPNFADAKARLLFPPPPKPVDEVLVRGTMDWVLFHRRRNKQCQVDVAPPPPPPPPRRFAFWMGVANERGVVSVRSALQNNTPFNPDLVFFRRVDELQFEPGLATMISRPEDVNADWRAGSPGETIAHVAIASATANDGDAVATGRWQRVAQAVSPVSQTTPGTTAQILSTVHPDLAVPGTDGIVLFVTLKAPVCHSVFRVRTADAFERAVKLIFEGQVAEALNTDLIVPLGSVLFNANTAVVSDANSLSQVKTKWDAEGGQPDNVAVVVPPQPPHTPATLQLDQARTILAGIGPSSVPLSEVVTPVLPTPPVTCPAFSLILAVQPRSARLLVQTDSNAAGERFFATTRPAVMTVQFNPDGSLASPLPASIVNGILSVAPNRIGNVELGPATPGGQADTRVKAIFQELGAKNLLQTAAANRIVTLRTTDFAHLDLGGGQKADDLIFLIR